MFLFNEVSYGSIGVVNYLVLISSFSCCNGYGLFLYIGGTDETCLKTWVKVISRGHLMNGILTRLLTFLKTSIVALGRLRNAFAFEVNFIWSLWFV